MKPQANPLVFANAWCNFTTAQICDHTLINATSGVDEASQDAKGDPHTNNMLGEAINKQKLFSTSCKTSVLNFQRSKKHVFALLC